jgi:hypothetical protein
MTVCQTQFDISVAPVRWTLLCHGNGEDLLVDLFCLLVS